MVVPETAEPRSTLAACELQRRIASQTACNRDMGLLEGRLKEWMMSFHIKSHETSREAAWEFDATKMALPTPAPSEDLVSLNSFLRERTI